MKHHLGAIGRRPRCLRSSPGRVCAPLTGRGRRTARPRVALTPPWAARGPVPWDLVAVPWAPQAAARLPRHRSFPFSPSVPCPLVRMGPNLPEGWGLNCHGIAGRYSTPDPLGTLTSPAVPPPTRRHLAWKPRQKQRNVELAEAGNFSATRSARKRVACGSPRGSPRSAARAAPSRGRPLAAAVGASPRSGPAPSATPQPHAPPGLASALLHQEPGSSCPLVPSLSTKEDSAWGHVTPPMAPGDKAGPLVCHGTSFPLHHGCPQAEWGAQPERRGLWVRYRDPDPFLEACKVTLSFIH